MVVSLLGHFLDTARYLFFCKILYCSKKLGSNYKVKQFHHFWGYCIFTNTPMVPYSCLKHYFLSDSIWKNLSIVMYCNHCWLPGRTRLPD